MEMQQIINTTKNAILSLSNPIETLAANQYLVDFEKSLIAWEVSELLIKENDPTFRFFGAKFLYSKIQKQYYQLKDINNNNASNMLLQSIIQHILQLSQDNNLNVCRYLCLSLAALTLQMKQIGLINQILIWLNPIISSSPIILLELLIVLPEEAFNYHIDVNSSTRDLFINQLSESANDVLSFLSTLWTQVISNNTKNSNIQSKILICAWKWIDATNLPSNMIITKPIYQCILQSLQSSDEIELFESAVDAIIIIYKVEYIRNYQQKTMSIIESSIPSILATRQIWNNLQQQHRTITNPSDIDDDDINIYRIICRLFTEVSESLLDIFIDLNLSSMNMGQVDIINQLLECTTFRFDPSICRIPLKFFYELAMNIRIDTDSSSFHAKPSSDEYDDGSNGDENNNPSQYGNQQSTVVRIELNKLYSNIYQHLLDISMNHVQLSLEVLQGQIPIPEVKVDIRSEWKETIVDCCYVLGSSRCLEILCMHLQNSSIATMNSSMDYSKIEASLFAIQQISGYLSKSESIFTPQILNFASSLPHSTMPRLRITVIELFSKFSFWFAINTSHISIVLSQLFQDLQQSSTSLPAADGILNIFRTCCHLPGLPIEELLNLMNNMKSIHNNNTNTTTNNNSTSTLSIDAELLLLEAIVIALSLLPQKESETCFHAISNPIVQSLSQLLSQQSTSNSIDSSMLIPYIDRITVIFQNYKCQKSKFSTELFISLIPLFHQILQICPTERIAEHVCRCYKHSIRNLTKYFGSYLVIMTEHLSQNFTKTPYSAYLYAASILISTFALNENGIYIDLLYQMLWNMSNTFFQNLTDIHKFEDRPDMVEEYYFLLAKALRFCPLPFILGNKSQINTIISAGILGLSLKHREAQKGILLFFERFVQLSTFWNDNSNIDQQSISMNYNQIAKNLIIEYAPSLLQVIFTLLSGIMPAYALDESNGCISDVLWYLKKKFIIEFKDWLVAIATTQLSETAQKVAENQNFIENLHNSKTKSEFCIILDRYEATCRRSL